MAYSDLKKGFNPIDLKEMRKPGFIETMNEKFKKAHEAVNNGKGWAKVSACPLCGSKDCVTEFSKFDVEMAACQECSLRYSIKVPVSTEDVYSDATYLPRMQDSYQKNADYRQIRFGEERLALIEKELGSLSQKSLLDVGCGSGWFLELAKKRGMKTNGLELGKELAAWTAKRLDIEVFDEDLAHLPKNKCFDVITMFDLLEHVKDPVTLIENAKKHLNPNGILLIFTPNFDSLGIAVMGKDSTQVCPTEHLTIFTKKAVEILAKKTETDLVYFRTCGMDLGDIKSYFEYTDQPELSQACEKLFDQIQPLVDAAESGNHMRFILKVV